MAQIKLILAEVAKQVWEARWRGSWSWL